MALPFASVAVRSRPLLQKEKDAGYTMCLEFPDKKHVTVGYERTFESNYVFDENATQEFVYQTCGSAYVQNFLNGSNSTIIAYGQTGSGKTFTMGTNYEHHSNTDHVGIIPRVVEDIFSQIARDDNSSASVSVSFYEIYNEEIFDLLSDNRNKAKLHDQGNYVVLTNITEKEVLSAEETLDCLRKGGRNRTIGATAINTCSSRSHTIFTINLQQKLNDAKPKFSTFTLVDLAGSETAKKTKAEGERFHEGVNINKGLMNLGLVISTLGNKGQTFVPYRNSILTQVLKVSLSGSGKILMIACVSPAHISLLETVNTIKYAIRALGMQGKPVQMCRISQKENNPYRKDLDMIPATPANRMGRFSSMPTPNCYSTPFERIMNTSVGDPVSVVKDHLLMPPPPPIFIVSPISKSPHKEEDSDFNHSSPATQRINRIVQSNINRTRKTMRLEIMKYVESLMSHRYDTGSDATVEAGSGDSHRQNMISSPLACRTNLPPNETLSSTVYGKRELSSAKKYKYDDSITLMENTCQTMHSEIGKKKKSPGSCNRKHYNLRAKEKRKQNVRLRSIEHVCPEVQEKRSRHKKLQEKRAASIVGILNSKSVRDLQCLPLIGQKTAQIIFGWRSVYGPFKSIYDINKIKGLPKTFAKRFFEANTLV